MGQIVARLFSTRFGRIGTSGDRVRVNGESDGRPEYLSQQAIKSRERLGLEQIGLWQLHRIDPRGRATSSSAAVK
jgi:aryl-alcohol dehydrogenase-like predicted oxidoreductase